MRSGGSGGFRRAVAGMLVLALLALSGAPLLAASPVGDPIGDPTGAHDCMAAADAPPPASGQSDGDHHGAAPTLACCLAALCPMLLGRPPAPPPEPLRSAALRLRPAMPAERWPGIDRVPDLPPPRRAA